MPSFRHRSPTFPWPGDPPGEHERRALADAAPTPFWLDRPEAPEALPPPDGEVEADLAIVGGGLSGLWAAVLAADDDSQREIVLLEADAVAAGATGRNGGFIVSSLTHGIANGLARFPAEELATLERFGLESFAAIVETLYEEKIGCDLELTGTIDVALEPHELEWLEESASALRDYGHAVALLDREQMQAEVASPLYLGGIWQRTGAGLVDPARLAWGLRRVARDRGVRIYERSRVERLSRRGAGVELRTAGGTVKARRALLATAAERPLVGAMRRRIVPVFDYVLVTEPLDALRREAIGWRRRQGIGDSANRFHYYRLTADDRILWGGYDAIYHYGNRIAPELERRERSYAELAQRFFHTFPQLEGIRFTHRWAGAIDTCSRFFAFYGTAHRGRVGYLAGHTGLGVGASRFAARLALDRIDGHETEATALRYARSRPLPFPPEPLRWAAIELTRNRLAAADRNQGRRGIWLRALDRLGLGFDS